MTRAFSVTVRDETTSQPLPDAVVCINGQCARTSENGRVRIEGISADWHQVQLQAEAEGYAIYSASVNIDKQPPFGDVDWPDLYLAPLSAVAGGLRVEGDHFMQGDQRFLIRGTTEFRLPELALRGVDIAAVIADRMECGANLFRMLSMKKNNTGYRLDPRDPRHSDAVRHTLDAIGDAGAYAQWCVFADTKEMMPDPHEQQEYWLQQQTLLQPYTAFTLIECCNEASHTTQLITPGRFAKPVGYISSHGSETADRFPVRPLWDWAGYSARRDGSRGKVISNYAQLTAFEQWPPVCLVPQETIKPESYGFDPTVAAAFGKYARAGTGGTFHHSAWLECRPFNEAERACAIAFYDELQ